jgi:glycosyltransferase involved in cell wall biosynthesis
MSLDVLVPHFRDPAGLALSLDSIAAQDWTGDIRVVIADDGSPEPDFRAVEALVAGFRRDAPHGVTLVRSPENLGRPRIRNRLLGLVEASHVAWLDAGDIWYPEKLSRQFEHLSRLRYQGEDPSRIWVTCAYDWQRGDRRPRHIEQEVDGDQLRELMLGDTLRAYLWTLLGTAETFRAVGSFDEALPRMQDLDYFIRFVRGGGRLVTPPEREALCRYHKSDVGRDAAEIRRCNQRIFEKYRSSLETFGPDFIAAVRYKAETLAARFAKHNGDTLGRSYYLGRAFLASPRRSLALTRSWLTQGGA